LRIGPVLVRGTRPPPFAKRPIIAQFVGLSMEAERWQLIEELFGAALELHPEDRKPFLDAACNGDDGLRREVDALLASHSRAGDFIQASAVEDALNIIKKPEPALGKGQRIGPYEVLREIGRGGMGAVYLAARADDQYKKRVAIKLVKRGMDTEDILRRFRNERQILASLDHPNIARLLDGGMTPEGLPFFAMEYVEGLPLIEFCDAARFPIVERLKLFRKICSAVQHAHQNLIVHRDLKPNNILVTSEGEPKLLDFGIAKFLNPELSPQTIAPTAMILRVMTRDYASPEQVRGLPITTASDVYSLGVLLYKLLTGHHPYQFKTLLPGEIERVICERVPERPSAIVTRTETVSAAEGEAVNITPESVGSAREAQPVRLKRALSGDLDNIVLMAMRKEPQRRYASVAEFSEDIRRHLDGLPINARPNVFSYRAAKFVKRNRIAVAAASLILLSLIVGLIATLWQAKQTRRERAKAEEIKSFLVDMLNQSNPLANQSSGAGRETTVSEVLDDAARRLDSGEFSNQPEVKAELEQIIAYSYYGQGKYHVGGKHLQEYIRLLGQLYGEHDPRALVASSISANLLFSKGEMTEAEDVFRQTLPPMRDEQRRGKIKAEDLVMALNNFAYLRRTQGDSKEAESLFREALALNSQIPRDRAGYVNGTTRSTLASTIADQGRFDEALQTAREAVAEERQRGDMINYGFALTIVGGFLTDRADYAEGDASLQEAEAIFRKVLGPSDLWLGDNLRNQAISLYQQQQYAGALSKAGEAQQIYLESFGTHYDHYPTVLIVQGLSLTKTGRPEDGERILREALKIRTESLPKGHYWLAIASSALGECLTIQRRYAEAEPLLVGAYNGLEAAFGDRHFRTIEALKRLVALYEGWGKPALAAPYRAKLPATAP
jgi:serine/threonine protein kinase